ncbi:MAG: hypothetical protein ACOX7N_05865 [Lawsonibacter sp.]|jgi:hypothetical protein
MRKQIVLVLVLACIQTLIGCEQAEQKQQGNHNMQYFFSGKVMEVHEEFLQIQVDDIGNSNLAEGDYVEVSTNVLYTEGCPKFTVGEYAKVLLAQNVDDSASRFDALSVYKTDENEIILSS